MKCNYITRKDCNIRTLIIDCAGCDDSSTLLNKNCRRNIIHILINEADVGKLILKHSFVKVFDGSSLQFLKNLAQFVDSLNGIENDKFCAGVKKIDEITKVAMDDPILAFQKLREISKKPFVVKNSERNYREIINNLIKKSDLEEKISCDKESNFYYLYEIRPYVRPIFFDTYIRITPPSDAVFIKKYEIRRNGYILKVSLYSLSTRPEKLYFIIPPEFNLADKEIEILQKVKEKLAKYRPSDSSFMEAETSRQYFSKFAKTQIKEILKKENIDMDAEKIEFLSDIFAKYTAGLGLLEDLLMDKNIQDVYINAPVENNPVHIILEGEEYTSNIYLSQKDVDVLSSRFRILSGRPFSEASPVLDMALEKYGSRISAISNPLTPKGIAFAIRKHSITPWTLPKFIANNMLSVTAAGLLSFFVDGQATILIAGTRGAGKTSLLSSLILEIPQRYRILTLEDTPEIPVEQLQSLGYKIQSLITQPITSIESKSGITPEKALLTALRLGESVLIIGEVRGRETKVLFEAMRVGAAGNVVLGTIHGATTRDVFERIVYDIGVAPTSFKATDIVLVLAPIRTGGSMEKKRRVIQISEVLKEGWRKEVDADKIFADIMKYNAKIDKLEATDLLDMGQSKVIEKIARDWGISIEEALENIFLRKRIREKIVEKGKINSNLLEAKAVRDANNAFWMLIEESRREHGSPDYEEVENKWRDWYKSYIKRL
ncbi:MAG TPA: type II secretion system protein E [Thermoplasmata archaeon]|nr:type II secretion system protein E [Thermoplasmata archaeon]